ncbi:hypothetical protein ACS0TY_025788 [Phlomoides rotata]
MGRLQISKDRVAKSWKGKHPPKIREILDKNMQNIGDCMPIKSNNKYYQIVCFDGSQFAVDLEHRKCSSEPEG